ncbi:MAG: VacJ family lipoprotein [Pseudomonadota bacterium]
MLRYFCIATMLVTTTACASTDSTSISASDVSDPFEGVNRRVFAFNEAADKAVIGPVARAYGVVTPEIARTGISNALSNLNQPVVFANDVLQGESERAGDSFYRFFVNSTIGILGFWDAAAHFGVEGHSEDFGQTLAVWGVDPGPFLVLPFLGPSNVRDLAGTGVDAAINPINYVEFGNDADVNLAVRGSMGVLGALNARLLFDDAIQTLREQPEPYIAYRRIYSQTRDAAIRNGREEEDPYKDLPEFDDF